MSEEIIKDAEEAVEEVVAEETAEAPAEAPVEVVEQKQEVITAEQEEKTGRGLAPVVNNTIGSTTVKGKSKAAVEKEKKIVPAKTDEVKKVAIYSNRNVSWDGVGKVIRGYNIVSETSAEQWLKRDHVRLATPEEIAKELNK